MGSLRILVPLFSLVLAVGTMGAQTLTPITALERLCTAEQILAAWFAPSFLAAVPLSEIERIFTEFKAALGRCQRIMEVGDRYVLIFERGQAGARIALDEEGRIASLLIQRPRFASLEHAVGALRELRGRASLLVLEDGRERAAVQPEAVLAVGSAFKLTVLAALKAEITAGRRKWTDVVSLRPEWKSLPSGNLQNAPDGSEHTLQRLAELMISISDNTATDVLIHTLGREAVEALAPPRNRPFLTTREFFILKDPRNRDLLERYRNGNEAARRIVLQDAQQRTLPTPEIFEGAPQALDVEWFYTARELCVTIAGLADLALMGINPGVAIPADWSRIAYKGGSEPGILNLTTFVEGRDRKTYCVATTWNDDAPLRELRFFFLHTAILELLK